MARAARDAAREAEGRRPGPFVHATFTLPSYFFSMKKKWIFIAALLALAAGAAFGSQLMMGPLPPGGTPWWGLTGYWWDLEPAQGSQPLTVDQAVQSVQRYLQGSWGPDFEVAEVVEFDNHFYARVAEKSTGTGAFELLVNRWTGVVVPEPGPNIRWNIKYGSPREGQMGTWLMGGPDWRRDDWRGYAAEPAAGPMPVTVQMAREYAQEFLDQRLPGTTVGQGDTFYGYYTLNVLKDGKRYGMLGVNGYTGSVWYQEWNGRFLQARELESSQ
jgi:hypothetical protein